MSTRRKRRTFTKEFKKQVVDLHQSGKPRKEIIDDYDLTPFYYILQATFIKAWLNLMDSTGE